MAVIISSFKVAWRFRAESNHLVHTYRVKDAFFALNVALQFYCAGRTLGSVVGFLVSPFNPNLHEAFEAQQKPEINNRLLYVPYVRGL